MEITRCLVCGLEFKTEVKNAQGRPRQFHKECRELNNALNLLDSRFEKWRELNPTKEKKNMLRKSLWSMINTYCN